MFHSLLFGTISIVNIFFYVKINGKKTYEKSISLFFHLYFCILSTFVYKDDDLIHCAFIYFTADSVVNIYFNTFKTFNKFHHLFVIILLLCHENLDKDITNYSGMHEFSTIILCLIDLKLISKLTFEKIFPLSFIMCRLIIFNYYVCTHIFNNFKGINTLTMVVVFMLNIMNIGIVIKMRLVQKIVKLIL